MSELLRILSRGLQIGLVELAEVTFFMNKKVTVLDWTIAPGSSLACLVQTPLFTTRCDTPGRVRRIFQSLLHNINFVLCKEVPNK